MGCKSKKRIWLALAAIGLVGQLGLSGPLGAEELRPDLISWSPQEGSALDDAKHWDTEYASDRLTYSLPLQWDLDWRLMDQGYRMSLGSLSSKRFANLHEVKLSTQMNETVGFKFYLLEESDFDHQYSSYFLELSFRLNEDWSWSIFGAPATYKANDDIGVAVDYAPTAPFRARLFYNAVDFSRNQRSEGTDRFIDQPAAYGVLASQDLGSGWILQGAWRQEKPLSWKEPDTDRLYNFSRSHWQLRAERTGHQSIDWYVQSYFTKKYEAQGLLSTNSIAEQAWTDRGGARLEAHLHAQRVNVGVHYEDRMLRSHLGNVRFKDIVPYAWTYLPFRFDHLLWIGYEFTYHQGRGPVALRSSIDKNRAFEHRLNWVWEWKPKRSVYLRLLATFDMDRLTRSDAWEGGAGQFMAEF